MAFSVPWHTLLDRLEELPEGATLITPLSHKRFRVTDVQEHRIIVHFEDSGEKRPLQREQFETLFQRIQSAHDGFELDRLPTGAEPYPAVLSLHPRYEVDEDAGIITRTDEPTTTQLLDSDEESPSEERAEPDELDIYSDTLLLIDALERHDVTDLPELETDTLVNLYTLLSDVQRDANDFRQDVADVLLSRLHHDRPVSGLYGSVQRTSRRNRSLKDEDDVLAVLEEAGIDRERIMSVDHQKVDDALEVTALSESDVYEIEEREYIRKAAVDEDMKETRLQGLKDRLATSSDGEADRLRREIEALEGRIDDLTSFRAGSEIEG